MDAADGCATIPCPICKSNGIPKNSWRTLEGKYIPIKKLSDDHLKNIIKHIKERKRDEDAKILAKMLAEYKRRK
jgi:hypothetical protein